MINETRNILLTILELAKKGSKEKDYYINELLFRYETQLRDNLRELDREKAKVNENLELIEYIKKEIKGGVNND